MRHPTTPAWASGGVGQGAGLELGRVLGQVVGERQPLAQIS